ncbi:MAG: hypothetical protein QXO46_08255 [Nitrososphaerota archaeon]
MKKKELKDLVLELGGKILSKNGAEIVEIGFEALYELVSIAEEEAISNLDLTDWGDVYYEQE